MEQGTLKVRHAAAARARSSPPPNPRPGGKTEIHTLAAGIIGIYNSSCLNKPGTPHTVYIGIATVQHLPLWPKTSAVAQNRDLWIPKGGVGNMQKTLLNNII